MNPSFSPAMLDRVRTQLGAQTASLFIDGRAVPALSGETIDVIDPATGDRLGRVAAAGTDDANAAVAAARKAFEGPWRKTTPAQRARLLNKLADLVEANAEELALVESLDNGMPYFLARFGSIGGAIEQLRYNAGWATKLGGETIAPSSPGEWHAYTQREAVGVVAGIVPWNMPFVMAVAKLAPALAAGCTIVLKPAEQTPLSATRLGALLGEAGLPEGVVNIIPGLGATAGAALVAHPDVDKVSFTGSTVVGKAIQKVASDSLKRVSLELGGKSPVFLFPDADLDRAIPAAATGIFLNSGQICAAGSRLFVHRDIYERVVEGIVARAGSLRLGAGLAPGTEMGPLVSAEQRDRVLAYVAGGADAGATIAAGGAALDGPGWFMHPTVMTGTAAGMKVVDEEIFGPVLCAMRFDEDDIDLIAAKANATDYGLSSSIWTRDISTALKLANRIRAGTVQINGGGGVDPAIPMGGFRQSGWGRENGRAGVETFTELKSVTVAL